VVWSYLFPEWLGPRVWVLLQECRRPMPDGGAFVRERGRRGEKKSKSFKRGGRARDSCSPEVL